MPASKSRDGTGSLPDKPGCSLRQGRDRALATKPSERCPHTAPTFSGPCIWTICFFCCNLNISRPPTQIPDPHDLRHTCLWTHQTPKPRPSDIGSTGPGQKGLRTHPTPDPADPGPSDPDPTSFVPTALKTWHSGQKPKHHNVLACGQCVSPVVSVLSYV